MLLQRCERGGEVMASTARWVHGVTTDGQLVMVTVGPNQHTVSTVVPLGSLPRQDLRRVCAHLGLSGAMNLTNSQLLQSVLDHCGDPANVEGDGKVRPGKRRTYTPAPVAPAPAPAPVVDAGLGGLGDVMTAAIHAAVRAQIAEALQGFTGGVDEAQVMALVQKVLGRKVEVRLGDREPVQVSGRVHFQFETLIRKVKADHVFITGEPGVGKTRVTRQIAEAMGVPLVSVSADPLPQRFEVLGGVSPITGKTIEGAARDPWENGGVLLLDEIDLGHPSLTTTMNKLLDDDVFHFDREGGGKVAIPRHPLFRCVATGNTYGLGGSLRFVGAQRMNAASVNRFTMFHMVCDEAMVEGLLNDVDPVTAAKVLPIWKQARANVQKYDLDEFVSPRCAIKTQKAMLEGLSVRDAFSGNLHDRGQKAEVCEKLLEGITF